MNLSDFAHGLPLILLLSAFAASTRAAENFPQNYRACALKNGCLPEAYGFYDTFKRHCPAAPAELMLLELPDDDASLYGHAVVVFELGGRNFLWDHEVGMIEVERLNSGDKAARRLAVAQSYLDAVDRLKSSPQARLPHFTAAGAEACALVNRLLAARNPMSIEFRTHDRRLLHGVAFTGGGMMWFYCPEQGTAFVRAKPTDTLAALVHTAVQASFPRAEIAPAATGGALVAQASR